MRSWKGLLALLVVFGGIVAYLYFVDAGKPVTAPGSETKDKVFTVDAGKIDELTVTGTSGETAALKKAKSGWQLTSPADTKADETEVSGITSNLASAEVTSVVDDSPKDLTPYGLKEPRIRISFKAEGDKSAHTLLLGSKTPTGGDLYAQKSGQKRVFLVPAYLESSFDKKPFDLREKNALQFDRDKVDRLTLSHGKTTIEFAKNGSDWTVTAPIKARADFSAIEGVVSRLQSAQMTSIEAQNADDLKKYGLDEPAATATVGSGSTRATLLIGSSVTEAGKTGVYARDASRPMVFVLPKDVADELEKGLDDFRRKDVFEFRSFNAKRLEITRGAESFVFEKVKGSGKDAAEKWRRVSPRPGDVDASKMETLLSKLSNLRAQSFADAKTQTGLATPALVVKAVYDENRQEEVRFGRAGSDVYAARGDEPGAMKIDTKEFDEAVQALDAVK